MNTVDIIDKRIKVLTESGKTRAFFSVKDAKEFVAICGGKLVYCQIPADNPMCARLRSKK